MKLVNERPHLVANCRDGSSWLLNISEQESFEAAWMAGKAFWIGLSARGARVAIKLADITGTALNTADVLEELEAEREEEQRRKLTSGDSD